MLTNDCKPGRFAHEKELTYGAARVPYDDGTYSHVVGWVLPGGVRVTTRDAAITAAVRIDRLLKATNYQQGARA